MKINEEEKKIECAPESLYEALVRSTDDFVYFCDWKGISLSQGDGSSFWTSRGSGPGAPSLLERNYTSR